MEWIKLRTLRSPWVTLLITVAGVVGLATAVGLNSKDTHGDITSNVLAGVAPGLLAFGVLGVLVMTNEYSSGLIKATLAAVPHRGTLLAAKTAVFGAAALAVGEIASFAAFFVGQAFLDSQGIATTLSADGVLQAVQIQLYSDGGWSLDLSEPVMWRSMFHVDNASAGCRRNGSRGRPTRDT